MRMSRKLSLVTRSDAARLIRRQHPVKPICAGQLTAPAGFLSDGVE
jgi:hypothetical protein